MPRALPWLCLLLTPALALAAPALAADAARDTLAWAGARAVTADELQRRMESVPWPGPPGGADSANVRALESLVAEKLLAQEAERRGLGAGGRVAAMRAALVRALARDALYRKEVGNDSTRAAAVMRRVLA